ncbi:MAG: glycosyltransferase [Thermosynechococcaceae cyanobacterium MS004]|nr:glycosyltransferase [Thermosynechococcaceae cyanobacterium MS004]
MKIAIITSGFLPVIDGVTVSGMQRLQKLSEWGHEVLLLCPDYQSLSHIYPNWKDFTGEILPGVRVVNLSSTPFMDLEYERNVSPFSYGAVTQALQDFQPDIVHVDEPERLFFGFFRVPGVAYARRHNIPCAGFFRTNFLDYVEDFIPLPAPAIAVIRFFFRQIILYVYHHYDVTLVSSRVTHQKLLELGFRNTRYGNLLGFEPNTFGAASRQPQFWQDRYQLDLSAHVKLLFLGRLTPDKGWDFTLEALAQFPQTSAIAVVVAGDGPLRDRIETRLAELKITAHFLGRVSPEDVPMLLTNSDIHITASTKETRGLTILEAFAAGIPVLAPNAGGVVENIQDGRNGLLFAPNDPKEFGQKLGQLVGDRNLREEMGRYAKSSVAQYSWENTVKNLVEIWTDLIAKTAKNAASL